MSLSFPKWMLPAVVTIAIVGGGMAAAGALDGDDPVVDEPVPTTLEPTTTTLAPDDPVTDAETDESDSPDRYWGEECGDGEPTNHGGYVSSSDKGGAARSEAAHSPCGKPMTSVESPDEGDDEGDEGTEEEEEEEEEDVPPTVGASSHGSSHGKGHGKH